MFTSRLVLKASRIFVLSTWLHVTFYRYKFKLDIQLHKGNAVCNDTEVNGQPRSTINHGFAKFHCILCECKKVISKDNNLITALLFMKAYEKLACSKLVRVHHIKCLQILKVNKPMDAERSLI